MDQTDLRFFALNRLATPNKPFKMSNASTLPGTGGSRRPTPGAGDMATGVDVGAVSAWPNVAASSPVNDGGSSAAVSAATAPALTVADGAGVQVDGASAQSVAFAGMTGTPKPDGSHGLAGQVSGPVESHALNLSNVSSGVTTPAGISGNSNGGPLAGIYAQSAPLVSTKDNLPSYVYSSPSVTGVSLKLVWGTIEPSAGVFDWSTLDAEVSRAIASGKKISLEVEPYLSLPSWIFNAGVPDLHFNVQYQGGLQSIDIAPPWDPTYQQAYAQMMQALSNHLRSIPGAYQAVSMVKITGINQISSETRLPSDPNSIAVWQAAGYTPTEVIDAWQGFAASVNSAFPDKVLVDETANGVQSFGFPNTAFPGINNQGQQVTSTSPSYVDVLNQIITAGISLYGGRFAVDWTNLNSGWLDATVLAAEQSGAIGGWQTNTFLGAQGTGYGSVPTQEIPLTNATYQQILDFGISQGAGQYIEVWPTDIQQFPAALAEAAARIASAVTVAQGATADISAASAADVIFSGAQGTLKLDQSSNFTGYIAGFRGSDGIDLRDVAFGANTTLVYTANSSKIGGTLTVSDGTHTANVVLLGQFSAANLHLASDLNGGTLVTDVLVAPTNANLIALHEQSFAASSLFATSDPFAVQYDLWDTGTGGGYFALNGVALAANQDNYLTAAQLAQATYQSGSGSDTLMVRVSDDGVLWSNWSQSFMVSGPVDNGPVVTATSLTAVPGQIFAAASLFTARDPFGETIDQYDLWDSGTGGGHFVLNGVALAANHDNYLTATQLAQTTYQSGSGSDALQVRAGETGEWGQWSSFTVSYDAGPVVTATDITVGHDANLRAGALFTASDPFGDRMTAYQFIDNTAAPTLGYFVVNGVAQSNLQVINIAAAQLQLITFQSGWGTADLSVRAFDGTAWSAWAEFHVTAPVDTGPVVMARSLTTASGQIFAASSLFTARDPFGDALSQYDLMNSGTGGGHFLLNGVALAANQDNYLTATQLAQATYQGGSGSDTLQVRAYESGQWSQWSSSSIVSGASTINALATLELASSFSGNVTFAARTGTLKLDNSSSFAGSASGFFSQDRLDLVDVAAGANATIGYSGNSASGTLTVSDGTHTARINLMGQYSAASFVVAMDSHGGTLVSESTAPALAGSLAASQG